MNIKPYTSDDGLEKKPMNQIYVTGVERNKYIYTTCVFLYKIKEIITKKQQQKTKTTNKKTKNFFMHYIIIPVTTCPFNIF